MCANQKDWIHPNCPPQSLDLIGQSCKQTNRPALANGREGFLPILSLHEHSFKHRTSTFSWVLFSIAVYLGLDGRDVGRRKSFTFCPCSAATLEGSSQRPVFSRGCYLLVAHHHRADLNTDFVPRARPWSSTVKQEGCPPPTSLGMSSQVSGSDVAVKSLKKVCTFISYLQMAALQAIR